MAPISPKVSGEKNRNAERRVCRISIAGKFGNQNIGTGILIGPDLILTCFHVLFEQDGAPFDHPKNFRFRFDIPKPSVGGKERVYTIARQAWPPLVVSPSESWNLDDLGEKISLANPKEGELDFTIIKINGRASNDPFEDGVRGFLNLRECPVVEVGHQGVAYAFKRDQGPIVSSFGRIVKSQVPFRFQYDIKSSEGFSGGLILNHVDLPIGMHSARRANNVRQGITFTDILEFPDVSEVIPVIATPVKPIIRPEQIAIERIHDLEDPEPNTILRMPRPQFFIAAFMFMAVLTIGLCVQLHMMAAGQDFILILNATVLLACMIGLPLASKLVVSSFEELASGKFLWLILAVLSGLNVHNSYLIKWPKANLTISFENEGELVRNVEGYVAVRKDDGAQGAPVFRKIDHSGRARFFVDPRKTHYFGYEDTGIRKIRCTTWNSVDPRDYNDSVYVPDNLNCWSPNQQNFDSYASIEARAYMPRETDQQLVHNTGSRPSLIEEAAENGFAPLGAPGNGELIIHPAFALGYDNELRGPLWISHIIDTQNSHGIDIQRKYIFDSKLSERNQNGNEVYIDTGYTQGALLRSEDEARGETLDEVKERADDASLFSVTVPMLPYVKSEQWKLIEEFSTGDQSRPFLVHAFSGAIYTEKDGTADQFEVIGPNLSAVPKAFYRILYRKLDREQWIAIAFVVENEDGPFRLLEDLVVSFEDLENRTNLSFFSESLEGLGQVQFTDSPDRFFRRI